jgi:hypothetical protein
MARRRTSRSSTPSVATVRQRTPPSAEEVARRAYELYEARGAQPGWDLDDWLQAERELGSMAPADASEEHAVAPMGVVNDSIMET